MGMGDPEKSTLATRQELDAITNRVAVALAKREKLIRSWTAKSGRERGPEKTEEELDAEDAILYRYQPPYLGVGAAIPSHFLISDADQNNRSLRAKFFPLKGLKASKQRDADEKAASAKRGLQEESSDDEGGRSSLGKAKKRKLVKASVQIRQDDINTKHSAQTPTQDPKDLSDKSSSKPGIPPTVTTNHTITESKEGTLSPTTFNTTETDFNETEVLPMSSEDLKKERSRLRKKMKRKRKQEQGKQGA